MQITVVACTLLVHLLGGKKQNKTKKKDTFQDFLSAPDGKGRVGTPDEAWAGSASSPGLTKALVLDVNTCPNLPGISF